MNVKRSEEDSALKCTLSECGLPASGASNIGLIKDDKSDEDSASSREL